MDLPQSTPFDLAARMTARLEKVQWKHNQRAVARCPAHQDKNPSLVIDVAEDRLLVYCPAGCSTQDIVGAVGLTLADLFVDWPVAEWQRKQSIHADKQMLTHARHELWILAQCLNTRIDGDTLELADSEREQLAVRRLKHYLEGIYYA